MKVPDTLIRAILFNKISGQFRIKKEENESERKFDGDETVRAQVDAVTYRRCLHDRDAICRESVG